MSLGSIKNALDGMRIFTQPALVWSAFILLFVFSCVLVFSGLKLRSEIVSQVVSRDAEVLYSISLMELSSIEKQGKFLVSSSGMNLSNVLPPLVRTSELRGVIGLRIFDKKGRVLISIPDTLVPADLTLDELSLVIEKKTFSRFHSKVWLNTIFADPFSELIDTRVPLLEVLIPLHSSNSSDVFGAAQYWIDGNSTKDQFDMLDRRFFYDAQMILGAASLVIFLIIFLAFRKLHKSNVLLENRTRKLQAANRELVLTAKTSAIGAISANLIHGIKNPLAGLMEFITSQEEENHSDSGNGNGEWEIAAQTTKQINDLLHELVTLIREEDNDEQYDLTIKEIIDMVIQKAEHHLGNPGVNIKTDGSVPNLNLPNREGNLARLVLDNLVQNAFEASPAGEDVLICFVNADNGLKIDIIDNGPGLPDYLKNNPFVTCISSKPEGNGIGLAISHHISRYIGARLFLESTQEGKTCFSLFLPLSLQSL